MNLKLNFDFKDKGELGVIPRRKKNRKEYFFCNYYDQSNNKEEKNRMNQKCTGR